MPYRERYESLRYRIMPPRLYARFRAYRSYLRGEPELRLVRFLVDRRRASVDVGANKGVYTWFLARRSARVHAYEPNPKIFDILRRGAPANVEALPYALSDRAGTTTLAIPRRARGYSNQCASLERAQFEGPVKEVEVECRRLDDQGHGPVGFIKIDVEGHEAAVLRGAAETLRRDRPNLLIEIEEAHNPGAFDETFAMLRDGGYDGFALFDGTLRGLDFFDVQTHQRAPIADYWAGRPGQPYVFNFVFLPRGRPAP